MSGATAVGVDVGGTKTAVALVDVDAGDVLDAREIQTRASEGAEQLHARLREVLGPWRADTRPVGVAVPELVSPGGATLTDVVVPGLPANLKDAWRDLGITGVEADVRAAALAEARFGQGAGLASFAYVSVGTGISSCFVLDGRPWPGAHGAAILLGSGVLVEPATHGRASRPPLEVVAGGPALLERFRAGGATASTAEEVLRQVDRDPRAREVASATGTALGLGLAELVNLVDPDAVIVGGGLGSADGPYWDAAVTAARSSIWAEVARPVPILHGELGPRAAVIGAALLA